MSRLRTKAGYKRNADRLMFVQEETLFFAAP
jgi:hypothetical protein